MFSKLFTWMRLKKKKPNPVYTPRYTASLYRKHLESRRGAVSSNNDSVTNALIYSMLSHPSTSVQYIELESIKSGGGGDFGGGGASGSWESSPTESSSSYSSSSSDSSSSDSYSSSD